MLCTLYLEKEKGIKVSPSTIYRVLKGFRLIERTRSIKQQRKRKHHINKKRIKTGLRARAPGEVIQIDLKHLMLRGITYYQYTAIDKHSRLVFAKVYEKKTSRNTKLFIQEAMKYFGFSISKVQTESDGSHFTYGVAYLSWVYERTGTYDVKNAMHTIMGVNLWESLTST